MKINSERKSGILLHPTSLPSSYGIGDIGPQAYHFIDQLVEMGQSYWQILPIGPTDFTHSPYSSISTFAGNHLLISPDELMKDQLLIPEEIIFSSKEEANKVDFKTAEKIKNKILNIVCQKFNERASKELHLAFQKFCKENSYWLNDYSKYWVIKNANNQQPWNKWNTENISNLDELIIPKIIQFLFHSQWQKLRNYCHKNDIQIIGDMPIYVGYDSADVWANKELFQLEPHNGMLHQAGCPPCNFEEDGQIWGNPLYNWGVHEKLNFSWWQQRFEKLFEMVDIVRLDHFIGFAKYYRIPINETAAHNGEWVEAPGEKLFQTLKSKMGDLNVIAEDLGDVTEEVYHLRDDNNFPGMRVLQFELDQIKDASVYSKNSIVYSGTHDNNTILGWFEKVPDNPLNGSDFSKHGLMKFFQCEADEINWKIINYASSTPANTVVLQLQDLLGLGASSRFNTPGTVSHKNWTWRYEKNQLMEAIIKRMKKITENNSRCESSENSGLYSKLQLIESA